MLRRVVVLIFGIIQAFIILRIVLLLLNAREGNDLVAFILNTSQLFVAPFIGIFNRDELTSSGVGPRHRRDRGARRVDDPRGDRHLGHERDAEGAGLNRSLTSRISLQRGPFRPALPAASMAPATPGLGERPTGARVVRRHLSATRESGGRCGAIRVVGPLVPGRSPVPAGPSSSAPTLICASRSRV